MKTLFLSIFFSLPLLGYSQFNFKPDSIDPIFPFNHYSQTVLSLPNSDSIIFELRFWANSDFGGFVQLTFNKDSIWNYRRGYLGKDYIVRTMELTSTQPNIDSMWSELLKNDVLNLPNQSDLIYTYQKDGRTIKIGPENEETERLIHNTLDAEGYTVELFTKSTYHSYFYYNPIGLNEAFKKSGWTSIETEKFPSIAQLLIESFAMKEVYRANFLEKMVEE